jgi:RNA polymerase sigma-70 factor, ECF subfamily
MSPRTTGARLPEIEQIYRRDLAKFQRLATAIVGGRDAGCDAVQDAFARAVQRRADFRREGRLEGWLWRIVVTTARDAAARPRIATGDLRETGVVEDAHSTVVRGAVLELPERQRLVLFLRYYADLDYGTIAAALDISSGTVGATLSQARDNLRRQLEEVLR